MRRSLPPIVAATVAVLASTLLVAHAQRRSSPIEVIGRAEDSLTWITRQERCLGDKRQKLTRTIALMREVEGQRGRDAVDAMESLEQQATELDRQARACVTSGAATPAPRGPADVRYVDPPADPTADAVAQENPPTHVVERDVALVPHVRVALAERVDGFGRIDDSLVRAAVRGIGARLTSCYERSSRRPGQLVLGFTITETGRVTRALVEGDTIGDGSLRACVRTAATSLHASGGAAGGTATFSYTLRFF